MLRAPSPNVSAATDALPDYGITSGGLAIRECFRPSIMEFLGLLDRSTASERGVNMKIHFPSDGKLAAIAKQLCATVDKTSALRIRLSYGYISSIKVADSFDAGSPFCDQGISRLFYRFGVTAHEARNSWIFAALTRFLPALASRAPPKL